MRDVFDIKRIFRILLEILSFVILDFGLRYFTYDGYKFYSYCKYAPLGFSLAWSSLFVLLISFLSKKNHKRVYIIFLIISFLITYSEYLHFKILNTFYGLLDILLFKEGSYYFKYAFLKTDIKILLLIIISSGVGLLSLYFNKKEKEVKREKIDILFRVFMMIIIPSSFYISAYLNLGNPLDSFDASVSGKEVFNTYNDSTKNLQVTGLYENIYHSIVMYIKNRINDNKDEKIKEINIYLNNNDKEIENNEYTAIFKDKNLIFILLESIDKALLTEEVMPTLYKLSNEGLNFTNRYSPSFGEGQTINTEFATNTGLYTKNSSNIYDLNNTYRTSLANKFKEIGYDTASIHFNNGFYYNRKEFHENLGYDNHYALSDMELNQKKI